MKYCSLILLLAFSATALAQDGNPYPVTTRYHRDDDQTTGRVGPMLIEGDQSDGLYLSFLVLSWGRCRRAGSQISQLLDTSIPVGDFYRIVEADKVEGQVGPREFALSPTRLLALRNLAIQMVK